MKNKWKELKFEGQFCLILQEGMLQITEKDIKTNWAMLKKRIQVWEQKNAQQQSKPNQQQDNNVLGSSGK